MSESNRTFGGRDVAVFIDFENIYISVLAEYDVNPDFEALIEKAEEFGRVSVAQAYADWTPYSHYINSLHAFQIDPMYVPAYHYGEGGKQKGGAIKNSVDMFLCINAMKMLYSHPNIQTFVLVTGDRDFVPLIKTIREFGKRAVVIGVAGASSAHLAQSADEFFFYHQITDNLKPPEKEKPKIRDPYETLVEAVKLARQRGYVATLASVRLLMTELMGDFDQTKYKDNRGKPILKFKDFVKEAERRSKVKLFSTGSINEVFLPNEDPRKTSRFVEETLPPPEPVDEAEEPAEAEEESKVELEVSNEQWRLFINAMSPLEGAVPFVRVFDVIRGMRNQGLLDLSNKEVKTMIIKAIHLNLLNRSNRGRGRRTFYQLTADPAVLGQYIELPPAQSAVPLEPVVELGETVMPAEAHLSPSLHPDAGHIEEEAQPITEPSPALSDNESTITETVSATTESAAPALFASSTEGEVAFEPMVSTEAESADQPDMSATSETGETPAWPTREQTRAQYVTFEMGEPSEERHSRAMFEDSDSRPVEDEERR